MNGVFGNIAHIIRLPDLVTITNALLGFTAILMAAIEEWNSAAILILIAALADGLDGALARRGEPSVFGLNLDSLADLVSFGVAPAVMGYFLIGSIPIAFILPAMYLMCGILRLARFNVSQFEEQPGDDEFVGLPITAAGVCIALLVLVAVDSMILVGAYMILSVLMVSRIGYPKVRNFKILIPVGIVGIIFCHIIGLEVVFCFSWPLLVIIGGYLISPLIKEVYHVLR